MAGREIDPAITATIRPSHRRAGAGKMHDGDAPFNAGSFTIGPLHVKWRSAQATPNCIAAAVGGVHSDASKVGSQCVPIRPSLRQLLDLFGATPDGRKLRKSRPAAGRLKHAL